MGPIGCPETSVRNYHYLLRNNPEECSTLIYLFLSVRQKFLVINGEKLGATEQNLVTLDFCTFKLTHLNLYPFSMHVVTFSFITNLMHLFN